MINFNFFSLLRGAFFNLLGKISLLGRKTNKEHLLYLEKSLNHVKNLKMLLKIKKIN